MIRKKLRAKRAATKEVLKVGRASSLYRAFKALNMNNLTIAALFLATLAACTTANPAQAHSHGKSCFIVKGGSKDCKGAKVARCHDQAYLLAQTKANHLNHLVCGEKAKAPKSKAVHFFLAVHRCRICKCFLVPDAEKRTCKDLVADAKFVKKSCRDQATLKPFFAKSAKAKACLSGPNGATYSVHSGSVKATV